MQICGAKVAKMLPNNMLYRMLIHFVATAKEYPPEAQIHYYPEDGQDEGGIDAAEGTQTGTAGLCWRFRVLRLFTKR